MVREGNKVIDLDCMLGSIGIYTLSVSLVLWHVGDKDDEGGHVVVTCLPLYPFLGTVA